MVTTLGPLGPDDGARISTRIVAAGHIIYVTTVMISPPL